MPGQQKQTDLTLLINRLQAMDLERSATPCLSRNLHRTHGLGIREIADMGAELLNSPIGNPHPQEGLNLLFGALS